MSNLKAGALALVLVVVAALSGGLVGGGAAIALVRTAYNGPTQAVVDSEVVVHSKALGEPVSLAIRLPVEYEEDPGRRFPVLWVLDGRSRGEEAYTTLQVLSRVGVARAAIIVQVPSTSRGRRADFTPPEEGDGESGAGANAFLRFLVDEAIPAVAEVYRVDGERILVGHSLGGLFALHAWVKDPSSFDGYFVFSPSVWVDDQAILGALEARLARGPVEPSRLFLTLGADEGNEMSRGFDSLRTLLGSSGPEGLDWHAEITPQANHGNNPRLSIPGAAEWYWGGR
jgi:predicted alpha/beta superfamily hydrolase